MDRLNCTATWSMSLAVLLLGLESLVVLVTVAVLVWSPVVEAGTVKVTVMLLFAPAATVPNAAVKLPPGPRVTLPKLSVTVPRVKPDGKMSDTDTFWASEGPLLVTV